MAQPLALHTIEAHAPQSKIQSWYHETSNGIQSQLSIIGQYGFRTAFATHFMEIQQLRLLYHKVA